MGECTLINIGKTLYIMTDGLYLNIDHDSVMIKNENKILARIPLLSVSQIIIIANAVISEYLVSACSKYKITISYVSPYGRYIGTFNGEEIGNVTLRMRQYQKYNDLTEKTKIAKNIVLGKTVNQMSLLGKHADKSERIQDIRHKLAGKINALLDCDNVDSIRGIEGECASLYFSVFDDILSGGSDDMKFIERSRRPPKNRVNALLSLLYTIETTTCSAAISTFGLDPYLGYLHEVHPGRRSLACDLIEEFRSPVIDAFVLRNINLKIITEKDFNEEGGIFSLTKEGRNKILGEWEKYKENLISFKLYDKNVSIKVLPYLQAQLLSQYIRGDIPEYPPFTDWR